jgi:hypothetical protein
MTQDKKELLELAARAVGVCLHPEDKLRHSYGNWGCDTRCTVCGEDPNRAGWNPLTDDGDCARLEVKLRLTVSFERFDGVEYVCATPPGTHQGYDEPLGDDEQAARRLASTRAAAEVARQMK